MGQGNMQTAVWIVVGVVLLVMVLSLLVFGRIFSLWLRCFLARAEISLIQIVMMILRRSPADKICDLRIMAVQAGVDVRTSDIERAFLSGVDAELAVRAIIQAQELGREVSWEDALSQAKKDQYDDYVDRQHGRE